MKDTRILLAAVTALTLLAADSRAILVASDIATEFRKERQRSRQATINVDNVAQAAIPIGTEATTAEAILRENGFKVEGGHVPSQTYKIVGSRLEPSMGGFQDEYRIVLTIEGGRIVSVFGRIFWQSL
jgi:hypothetical protein